MMSKKIIFIALFFVLIHTSICKATLMEFHLNITGTIYFDDYSTSSVSKDYIYRYDSQDVTQYLSGETYYTDVGGWFSGSADNYGHGFHILFVGGMTCEMQTVSPWEPWDYILINGGSGSIGGEIYGAYLGDYYSSKKIIDAKFYNGSIDITRVVPEPATILLIISLSLLGITIRRLRGA